MHPCLSVDEILRLIACELVGSKAKATAVTLACCCKSFEDPGLDVLWKTQSRLPPLLISLPGDVWNEGEFVCQQQTISFSLNRLDRKSFKRPPTTLEWARFRKYARRMRKLRVVGDLDFPTSGVSAVLQSSAMGEPLFPNLKSLVSWSTSTIAAEFIPLIPSLLSPTTTVIDIDFNGYIDAPNAAIASTITTFPVLCPNIRKIHLHRIPRDPIIVDAVSELLLNINRDALRHLHMDSPLPEEVRKAIYRLPNLCELWVVVEGPTSSPTMVLPNLTKIHVKYDHNRNWWQGFHGAILGKLDSVTFDAKSPSAQIGDFFEEF
jgi:hypothetical protein